MTLPQIPRYRPGTDLLGFETPPADIVPETIRLKAEDGAASRGVLYAKGGEPTVVCVLHPRGDMTRHYLIPFITEAGFAVLGQESRSPNNDTMATHEALLADIGREEAGAIVATWLREWFPSRLGSCRSAL